MATMVKEVKDSSLRLLPSMDKLLSNEQITELIARHSLVEVKRSLDGVLDELRGVLISSKAVAVSRDELEREVVAKVQTRIKEVTSSSLLPVINATGVILHTNLGRSLLADEAVEAILKVAQNYTTLEYDLKAGKRGSRYSHCEGVICDLTGGEAALVVNNNAAALTLALNTFSQGREAIVSRGELVEIGGSFRIPEVMAKSACIMREIGATNKTHLKDYENAINENTGMLVKVHRSNFKLTGFVADVSLEELVRLGEKHFLPVLNDLGSGLLIDLQKFGLPYEPLIQQSVKAGVTLTTCSGDKLFGGPQAGIIIGSKSAIAKIKANSLTRAFRVDKLTLAALEATLKLYYDEEKALQSIPTLRMISTRVEELEKRAQNIVADLPEEVKKQVEIVRGKSEIGGGSYPGSFLDSVLISITPHKISVIELEEQCRLGSLPLIGRIHKDKFLLDVRCIRPVEDKTIVVILSKRLI